MANCALKAAKCVGCAIEVVTVVVLATVIASIALVSAVFKAAAAFGIPMGSHH